MVLYLFISFLVIFTSLGIVLHSLPTFLIIYISFPTDFGNELAVNIENQTLVTVRKIVSQWQILSSEFFPLEWRVLFINVYSALHYNRSFLKRLLILFLSCFYGLLYLTSGTLKILVMVCLCLHNYYLTFVSSIYCALLFVFPLNSLQLFPNFPLWLS